MKKPRDILKGVVGVLLLAGLAVVLSLTLKGPAGDEPTSPATASPPVVQEGPVATTAAQSPIETPMEKPTITPLPTLTPTEETTFQSPLPTPTPRPTPTIPPVPTPLPTPVVTPIPMAKPPFIPGIEDKPTEPYKIVVRTENTLWVMNNDGTDRRILIDTESQAGLYMRVIPWEGAESAGKWSASPDGTRLALTLFDIEKLEGKGQRIPASIHILDVATGDLRFLVEGAVPVWSPESSRIAFIREGGLWVVDAATGKGGELFAIEEEYAVEDFVWSPDGNKIAFRYKVASLGGSSEILLINADEPAGTTQSIVSGDWPMWGVAWTSGGKEILYVFPETEPTAQHFDNLWTADIETRASTPLTIRANVSSFAISPFGGDWIAFTGEYTYEGEASPSNDLWLVHAKSGELLRLTRNSIDDVVYDPWWSPDGTQIVFQRAEQGIWTMNLSEAASNRFILASLGFPPMTWRFLGGPNECRSDFHTSSLANRGNIADTADRGAAHRRCGMGAKRCGRRPACVKLAKTATAFRLWGCRKNLVLLTNPTFVYSCADSWMATPRQRRVIAGETTV